MKKWLFQFLFFPICLFAADLSNIDLLEAFRTDNVEALDMAIHQRDIQLMNGAIEKNARNIFLYLYEKKGVDIDSLFMEKILTDNHPIITTALLHSSKLEDREYVLLKALHFGSIDMLKYLFSQKEFSVEEPLKSCGGILPIHYAMLCDVPARTLHLILRMGADPNAPSGNQEKYTPLHLAFISFEKFRKEDDHIRIQACKERIQMPWWNYFTKFEKALEWRLMRKVQLLMDYGAEPYLRDGKGRSAHAYCCQESCTKILERG